MSHELLELAAKSLFWFSILTLCFTIYVGFYPVVCEVVYENRRMENAKRALSKSRKA